MSSEYKPGRSFGADSIDQIFPDRQFIAGFGWSDYRSELYYVPSEKIYIEKGAFGRWQSPMYQVCDFQDEAGAQKWINEVKAYWDRQTPPENQ